LAGNSLSETIITSLSSAHVDRVQSLQSARGKKLRDLQNLFIAEGLQSVREALNSKVAHLSVDTLYLTESARERYSGDLNLDFFVAKQLKLVLVSEQVMRSMTTAETPQGILAVCAIGEDLDFFNFLKSNKSGNAKEISRALKIAYFWQIQDPGNAGAVIRSADACGFDAVVFSPESVDIFNPKTVRATAGSLWHIPVFAQLSLDDLISESQANNCNLFGLDAGAKDSIEDEVKKIDQNNFANTSIWCFGNEARGLPELPKSVQLVSIPMRGNTESFNLAAAAAIVMYLVAKSSR
jgi:TrmH family RNA methyltransferase